MKVGRAKAGLGVKPPWDYWNDQLQSIGMVVSVDKGILIVATHKMMTIYGRELIDGSKDSESCCKLEPAPLASST